MRRSTVELATEAPPVARQEPTATPGATTQPRARMWNRHWPLPVSLALAIGYWLYLNEQVTREENPEMEVHYVTQTGELAEVALNIRTPRDYAVTELRDANSKKLFDGKVNFKITAPGKHLKNIERLVLLVNVEFEEHAELTGLSRQQYEWTFSHKDVKDAAGTLTPYIEAMEPPHLTVLVQKTDSLDVSLSADHVLIRKPEEGDWARRIFLDSLTFKPADFITLHGPKSELDKTQDEPQMFIFDITKKLEALANKGSEQRQTVSGQLQLKQRWKDKGIKVTGNPRASIEVAPNSPSFKNIKIDVWPDWRHSPLNAAEFKVDKSVTVIITSYNAQLTAILSDPAEAAAWLKKNLRCCVNLSQLDPTLIAPSKPDFQEHLTETFVVFDRNFKIERDLRVTRQTPIKVQRKTP